MKRKCGHLDRLLRGVRVYTKKILKVGTFFILVYLWMIVLKIGGKISIFKNISYNCMSVSLAESGGRWEKFQESMQVFN